MVYQIIAHSYYLPYISYKKYYFDTSKTWYRVKICTYLLFKKILNGVKNYAYLIELLL